MEFRLLRADEIEVRVAKCTQNGVVLLLYKDARVDQNILDETVGSMNWQRRHNRDNANCVVSLWDDEKKMWIEKEDTGKESNTEAEKGLASDSFKRACFNWGIGRELYTAPFIWVNASDCEIKGSNGKCACYDKFSVEKILYDERKNIVALAIKNTTKGKRCFMVDNREPKDKKISPQSKSKSSIKQSSPKAPAEPAEKQKPLTFRDKVMIVGEEKGLTLKQLAEKYGLNKDTTEERFEEVLTDLEGRTL